MKALSSAVFLDRDGVLIHDVDCLTDASQINILAGVPYALRQLQSAGFKLVVVTNQTVVARGLATEEQVFEVNRTLALQIVENGGVVIDSFQVCPHHPKATLERYRVDCSCRKPMPGMLLNAAKSLNLDLSTSFMIGDRITDILAGHSAGCRTIMLQTGKHDAPPIMTSQPIDLTVKPDHICADLVSAADWILAAHR